jgi:hypothetical protein
MNIKTFTRRVDTVSIDLDEPPERFEARRRFGGKWSFTVERIQITETIETDGEGPVVRVSAFGHRRLKDGRAGSMLREDWNQTGRWTDPVPPQVRAVVEQAGYQHLLIADGTQ